MRRHKMLDTERMSRYWRDYMFAANQLGLFGGSNERDAKNRHVSSSQGALVEGALSEGTLPSEGALSEGVLVRSGWGEGASLERGLCVDTAFAGAERYWLEVNDGRTRLVPVKLNEFGDKANEFRPRPNASWVEHVPRWLGPDGPLFEALLSDCNWQSSRRLMYDRVVDVPRLLARPPAGQRSTTLLQALEKVLSARYGRTLCVSSLALYRDGNDSVAPHGDKLGERRYDAVVAILSLGHPRLMRLRPQASQSVGRCSCSIDFQLGGGDLFVMGGRCQADWLHAIPKLPHAGARVSVMYREPELRSDGLPNIAAGERNA